MKIDRHSRFAGVFTTLCMLDARSSHAQMMGWGIAKRATCTSPPATCASIRIRKPNREKEGPTVERWRAHRHHRGTDL